MDGDMERLCLKSWELWRWLTC